MKVGREIARRAAAELELRAREERRRLDSRFDWYGEPCSCGLALGACRHHHRARENQRPPGYPGAASDDASWYVCLIEAGRGFGKTRCGAEWVRSKAEAFPGCHIALVNETVKDVRDVMIEGPGGLIDIAPPWCQPLYEPSKARVTWPNGSVATIYSAEQPGLLRGPQFHFAWLDELPKWRRAQQETWDMLQFGMRLGDRPQILISTTPKPTETYKKIRSDKRTVRLGGSTYDNRAQLAETFFENVTTDYAGTRLGRQELFAELLEDTPGALWTTDMIDGPRVVTLPPMVRLIRVAVGVDPGAGSSDPESGAETGIVVAARGSDGHGYVLDDLSVKGSPDEWAEAAVAGYETHKADVLAAEINNGGDMVLAVIASANPTVPTKKLWASRGKVTRAEPVARLYEQGKIHHVGSFPVLETQMTGWIPGEKSPDRMDALVWALTEVMLEGKKSSGKIAVGGERPAFQWT